MFNLEFLIKYFGLNDITKHVGDHKHKQLTKQKANLPLLSSIFHYNKTNKDKDTDVIAAEVAKKQSTLFLVLRM